MSTSQHSMIVSPTGMFSVQKMPVFKEERNYDWVLWGFPEDLMDRKKWKNNQPAYYEWLYNSSSKHRAIINRKCLFIEGKGVTPIDKGLNLEEQIALRSFSFKYNDSEFVKQITKNWLNNGWFTYEVIPDKGLKNIEAHYINSGCIRVSKPEYDNGREKDPVYYYTKDWTTRRPEDNPDFTVFHLWKWGEETIDKSKRYIVVQSDAPENPYPLPEYTAAVPYIAADFEVGNFVYNNTTNGFNGAYLVNFYNGEPTEEQKADINRDFQAFFQGSDNAGKPMLNFADDKESGIEIIPLGANGQDDRYVNLNEQIRDEIFAGHTVSPAMVGLKGEGGFANNADELRVEVENFQEYYVRGKQQVIERHLNAIRSFNGIKGEVYIQRLDPIQPQPTETELAEILTVDERRERAGYEPLEEVQVSQTKQITINLSKDDQIVGFLATCGIEDDNLEFLESKELCAFSIEDAEEQEYSFLSATENALIRLLLANPSLSPKRLGKLLNLSPEQVTDSINSLKESGVINEEGNVVQEPDDEVFVVYKYVERADAPPLKGESRPFCKNLLTLSRIKSWTLDDIKRMNNGMGLDVFTSRGGWYNNNGRITPYCRHVWQQRLVRRKNG